MDAMIESTLTILERELWKATYETAIMLGISLLLGLVFGLACGLLLYLSGQENFLASRKLNAVLGYTVNIVRSFPFIILVVFTLPLTFALTGTKIGPVAAAVPLSICAIAFYARLVEGSLKEVDAGVIEAALASGASKSLIVKEVRSSSRLDPWLYRDFYQSDRLFGHVRNGGRWRHRQYRHPIRLLPLRNRSDALYHCGAGTFRPAGAMARRSLGPHPKPPLI